MWPSSLKLRSNNMQKMNGRVVLNQIKLHFFVGETYGVSLFFINRLPPELLPVLGPLEW